MLVYNLSLPTKLISVIFIDTILSVLDSSMISSGELGISTCLCMFELVNSRELGYLSHKC